MTYAESAKIDGAGQHDDQTDMRTRQPGIVHQPIRCGDAARRRDDHRNDDQPVDDVAQLEIVFADHICRTGTRQYGGKSSAYGQNNAVRKQLRHIILREDVKIIFHIERLGKFQRIPKEIELCAERLHEYPQERVQQGDRVQCKDDIYDYICNAMFRESLVKPFLHFFSGSELPCQTASIEAYRQTQIPDSGPLLVAGRAAL